MLESLIYLNWIEQIIKIPDTRHQLHSIQQKTMAIMQFPNTFENGNSRCSKKKKKKKFKLGQRKSTLRISNWSAHKGNDVFVCFFFLSLSRSQMGKKQNKIEWNYWNFFLTTLTKFTVFGETFFFLSFSRQIKLNVWCVQINVCFVGVVVVAVFCRHFSLYRVFSVSRLHYKSVRWLSLRRSSIHHTRMKINMFETKYT